VACAEAPIYCCQPTRIEAPCDAACTLLWPPLAPNVNCSQPCASAPMCLAQRTQILRPAYADTNPQRQLWLALQRLSCSTEKSEFTRIELADFFFHFLLQLCDTLDSLCFFFSLRNSNLLLFFFSLATIPWLRDGLGFTGKVFRLLLARILAPNRLIMFRFALQSRDKLLGFYFIFHLNHVTYYVTYWVLQARCLGSCSVGF
jgi:hypothetical protein